MVRFFALRFWKYNSIEEGAEGIEKNKGRFSKNLPRFSKNVGDFPKNVGDFLGCVVEIVAWSSNSFLAFQCEKISIVKKSFKPPPHACARARTTEILHILLSQPSPFFV